MIQVTVLHSHVTPAFAAPFVIGFCDFAVRLTLTAACDPLLETGRQTNFVKRGRGDESQVSRYLFSEVESDASGHGIAHLRQVICAELFVGRPRERGAFVVRGSTEPGADLLIDCTNRGQHTDE